MTLVVRILLIIATFGLIPAAEAAIHVGPQLGFSIYHRNAPEETPSLRLSALLSVKFDVPVNGLLAEITASYENGADTFATQDSVNDRELRGRLGVIYNPFKFDFPLIGARLGAQYTGVLGVYNINMPVSTDTLHPHYWSPYFGLLLAVLPPAGFGVEIEFTTWYDQYFHSLIYQMGFGVDIF